MGDFEKIYQEHGKTVYSFLLSLSHDEHLSEELTQETMFRAIMNFNSFRGDCKLSVWLCQIAKNLYYEWYNKNRKIVPLDETFTPYEDEKDIFIYTALWGDEPFRGGCHGTAYARARTGAQG